MRRECLLGMALVAALACNAQSKTIKVTNTLPEQRNGEMVEVPMSSTRGMTHFVVEDETGNEIPYQITYNAKLIFQVNIGANEQKNYVIKAGKARRYAKVSSGSHRPERLGDISWENDMIGFRAYGPEFDATGGGVYGYDLFMKRVEYPVLDELYYKDQNKPVRGWIETVKQTDPQRAKAMEDSLSYHIDHGKGCDYYAVGPTLGCGTSALMENGAIHYPNVYEKYQILDNGPLRFTVKLTFPKTEVNGETVEESRIITLDAGSSLNRIEIGYEGVSKKSEAAVGLVMHDAGQESMISADQHCMAYADPVHPTNGQTYIGAVYPKGWKAEKVMLDKIVAGAHGHILATGAYKPGTKFVYYSGAGWSKWKYPTFETWSEYVKDYSLRMENRLRVEY